MKPVQSSDRGRALRDRSAGLAMRIGKAILWGLIFMAGAMGAASQVLPPKATEPSHYCLAGSIYPWLHAADRGDYRAAHIGGFASLRLAAKPAVGR